MYFSDACSNYFILFAYFLRTYYNFWIFSSPSSIFISLHFTSSLSSFILFSDHYFPFPFLNFYSLPTISNFIFIS